MQHIKLMRSISAATHSAWKMWFFEELLVKASGPSHQIVRRALPTLWLQGEWLQLREGCCTNIYNSSESLRSRVPLEEGKTLYKQEPRCYLPLLWSPAGDGCSMDRLFLLLSILFPFAFTLTEIWRLELPSACIQRDPLPCSAEAASIFSISPLSLKNT